MQRQKELASTSVQQVDDDGDDLEDFISRKLTRKDLPLLYIEPKSRPRRVCFRLLLRVRGGAGARLAAPVGIRSD